MQEVHHAAGEEIVIEGDFVDSFYFIAKGQAKITQKTIVNGVIKNIILATLNEEEAIGLGAHGFFSQHGRRTATVIALTDISLLRIDIESFNHFIKTHPGFDQKVKEMSELMLKLSFIKKTAPFLHLSQEEAYAAAKKIEKITLPANTIIFNQHDAADCCYLIQSGQVQIFIVQDAIEKSLAILDPADLLGETALLTGNPRNASARTLSECHLFVIKRDLLFRMIKNSKSFSQSILSFMIKHLRPTRSKEVTVYHAMEEGKMMSMLHNTELHQYYRLTEEGMFIWQQLDGIQTIYDLSMAFFQKYKLFAPEFICNLLYSLAEVGFVSIPSFDKVIGEEASWWEKLKNKINNITQIKFSLTHTDKWLTKVYKRGIFLFYTWPLQLALFVLAIAGLSVFIYSYPSIIKSATQVTPRFWHFLILFIPISVVTVIIHEAGHAFTAKKLGYKIQRMGIGWLGLGPIAYVDTSELWVANKKTKILVNIAGPYVDLIISACFALFSFWVANPELSIYFWLLSLLLYYNGFRNLSPIKEYDGYFILTDILNYSRLRRSAIRWLALKFTQPENKSGIHKKNKYEIYYWLICTAYLFTSALLLFFIFQTLFKVFSVSLIFGIPIIYLSALLAILMLITSIIGIGNEIKKYLSLM